MHTVFDLYIFSTSYHFQKHFFTFLLLYKTGFIAFLL